MFGLCYNCYITAISYYHNTTFTLSCQHFLEHFVNFFICFLVHFHVDFFPFLWYVKPFFCTYFISVFFGYLRPIFFLPWVASTRCNLLQMSQNMRLRARIFGMLRLRHMHFIFAKLGSSIYAVFWRVRDVRYNWRQELIIFCSNRKPCKISTYLMITTK